MNHTLSKNMFYSLFLALTFLGGLFQPALSAKAETALNKSPLSAAQDQLDSLTPQEKVGQLFLVTFEGTDTNPGSDIYDLITNYHIGGIVLQRHNDNFSSYENMAEEGWALINNLQWIEYNSSRIPENEISNNSLNSPSYIPLFVGLSQEGDLSSHSTILNGISPLPSQLAIGATWDPDLARAVGFQLGEELSALGVNMLFGPSLDVLSSPKPDQPSDLGVRSFGGDPYWVSKLGQAFISGVHRGSNNQMAVVGKFFPGLGSSDRLPDKEVATVRKSLDQLKQIDLTPFFSVTGEAPSSDATVDALLNSHIRYQGLQGNIRSTTRPISLDPQALALLMSLEPLESWRQNGGLLISDNLGSQSLRQLYDPTGKGFNIRQVALDAFIAGNDILYLGNTGDQNAPFSLSAIESTLNFFAQKYIEDQTFAERVDASLLRILALKYTIHDEFNISSVLSAHNLLTELGSGSVANEVARQSSTLISPIIGDLNNVLQSPPQLNDKIVILTDISSEYICSSCQEVPTLRKRSLEEAILRLYGPQSGRQIMSVNISSYSYQEVINLLDFPLDTEYLDQALSRANWIVVVSRDTSSNRPSSLALHRLLSERQDLIRDKKVIVFAMNAPYYLDATNISKLTAYFGIFSKLPSFIDVSARLLFKEIPSPPGDLPVSVPGIGYDLITATSPDPDQVIPLYLGGRPPAVGEGISPEATPTPSVYESGDLIVIETGSILDHNSNPVPDGTPVQFVIRSQGETIQLPAVITHNGMAETSFIIEQNHDLEIQAISLPAQSAPVLIRVKSDNQTQAGAEPTTTQNVSTLTPTPVSDVTEEPSTPSSLNQKDQKSKAKLQAWFLSLLTIIAVSIFAYQIGALLGQIRWSIHWGISSFISGMFVYNYLVLGLPGAKLITGNTFLDLRFGIAIFSGSLLGWFVSFLILKFSPGKGLTSKQSPRG